jgi:TonB family protein
MRTRHVSALVLLTVVWTAPSILAQEGPLTLSGAFFEGEKPGPIEQQARPAARDNLIPRRTVYVAPVYPDAADLVRTRAVIPLRVTVDESGYVAEVRRLQAPVLGAWTHPLLSGETMPSVFAALASSAIEAVRQWRYDALDGGPIWFDVAISFAPDTEPRVVTHSAGIASMLLPPSPEFAPTEPIEAAAVEWADGVGPLNALTGTVPPRKTKHVAPVYPQEAKDAHVQGAVVILARVGPDGRVSVARVLRSITQLDQAALDAVMQWEFERVVLDGEAVPYLITATVQFSLN